MTPRQRGPYGADLLILFISLLIAVTAAEIGLRLVAPTSGTRTITYRQTIPGVSDVVQFSRDNLGLRRTPDDLVKRRASLRILCLGASTAEQPTQSYQDTWCGQLESLLNARSASLGHSVETMIFGRGGWRATDLLAWAELNVDRVDPDVVILLVGINDLAWGTSSESVGDGIEEVVTASLAWQQQGTIKATCRRLSELCRRTLNVAAELRGRARLAQGTDLEWHSAALPALRQQYQAMAVDRNAELNPWNIIEFRQATDSLVGLLSRRGSDVVLLGQPVLWRADLTPDEAATLWFTAPSRSGDRVRAPLSLLAEEMQRYNDEQSAIADRRRVSYVDLGAYLPRTSAVFFDDCHFTDLGNRLVAETILPVVSNVIRHRSQRGTPPRAGR